jgi:very-short-patch-repair endonuclease
MENIYKKLGKHSCNVGNHEIQLLDKQEQKDSCKILRQWNTGLGYTADGYCKENNTVYEVYEKFHRKRIEHDLKRQNEIQKHLNCDFKIIWDDNEI